jgi:hypothetical protein
MVSCPSPSLTWWSGGLVGFHSLWPSYAKKTPSNASKCLQHQERRCFFFFFFFFLKVRGKGRNDPPGAW